MISLMNPNRETLSMQPRSGERTLPWSTEIHVCSSNIDNIYIPIDIDKFEWAEFFLQSNFGFIVNTIISFLPHLLFSPIYLQLIHLRDIIDAVSRNSK